MAEKILENLKINIKYGVLSHLLVFLFGVVRSLAVPLMLGIIDFGYWQTYLLYVGFVGVLCFGFNDGIYLRFGGVDIVKMPWLKLRGAIAIYATLLFCISLIFAFSSVCYGSAESAGSLISVYLAANIFLSGLVSFYVILFQITNQMKLYSKYLLIDKAFFLGVLLAFYFGNFDLAFSDLMILDCIGKFVVAATATIQSRNFIFGPVSLRGVWLEFTNNIRAGIKLTTANLLAMLMIHQSRIAVEIFYPIEDFSVFAFGISLTNLALLFILGVSAALYPVLKKQDVTEYPNLYSGQSEIVTFLMVTLIFTYYPIYYLIENWMLDFSRVLDYFFLLMVASLLQIKLNLTIYTFNKALRRESNILKGNIQCLCVMFVFMSVLVFFNAGVEMLALLLVGALVFRVYVADIQLQKNFRVNGLGGGLLELVFLMTFILLEFFTTQVLSFVVLLAGYAVYVYQSRKKFVVWRSKLGY